ncbi:ubiquitin carboxyl-terminal hydrolase 43 [Hippocampus zosterae]|uniref:ubiquitin carboxyl-terminal hydrolase 43 n=1 Tax=Hippocampus zosterae TaxID=109293 RepID=UPI00223D9A8B|nr:ubiquitin carboxyl-terminal hydrolase 43 [Hippocampus zosterae]
MMKSARPDPRGSSVGAAMDEKREMPSSKEDKRKEKKPKSVRLLRKKSLKSVGSFMNRLIIKTLGTFTHFADARDAEDDDGGFGNGTPCTLGASSGIVKEDVQVPRLAKNPPLGRDKLLYQYGDKTPGVLGLKNHGNTCFMNAVVQCLSNTDLLAEYLGLERYKLDLSDTAVDGTARSAETRVANGEVTEHLASLVRALWTLEYTPQLSVDFKAIVSKFGSQFRGNSQHDALEFLLWLLDRVHEDINLASHNNNNTTKACERDPDEDENLPHPDPPRCQQQHSFVQEHFQAQYKSSLTCPHCLKQSNTFDPFLCISLPIPLRQTRPVCVTLVFSTKGQRYLRVGLAVPLFGSVACLRRMVADEGDVSPDQVILTEVYATGFQRSFFDEDDLTSIAENDVIYAFQAPPLYIRGGSARTSGSHHSLPPSSTYTAGPEAKRLPASGALSSEFLNQGVPLKILLLVCNAAGAGQQTVRFGPPFLMREDRSISWDQLQQSILSKLYYLMINGAPAQNNRVLFNIRVVGGSSFYSYLSPQDGRPLYHPAVDRALKLCSPGGPPHVKLIIEWEYRIKDCLFGNIQEEVVKDADSVRNQQQQHVQQYSCTLDECFQLYTKEEQLAPDDAWKCPHCKQLQQGTVKMSLWTLPDILILHLKRFRQVGERRNKLTTFVRFPLVDLDMTPHVVNRDHRPPQGWKQASRPELAPPDVLYDLYAVCNHHGGMHGGHYTAFCRNSVDAQWYSYDDSNAEAVPEGDVCTRGAYILFYQRRKTIPPWSASSSVTGSTSSNTSDHWLVRLTSDRGAPVSAACSSVPPAPVQRPDPTARPVFEERRKTADAGESESKAFARGTHARSVSMRSPTKARESLGKVLPLRWSFRAKDRVKHSVETQSGELVEYLESGRRPRCTKEPIVALVATPPQAHPQRGAFEGGGQECSSPSGSSLSCAESCYSPKIPEGQSRPAMERHLGGAVKGGEDGSLRVRSSNKRARQEPGRTWDVQLQRVAVLGAHLSSHSAPPSRDSTLRKNKVHFGGSTRSPRDPFQAEGQRGREGRSQESLVAFVKPAFTRKDIPRSPLVDREGRVNGYAHLGKTASGHFTELSLSNGTLSAATKHERQVRLRNGRAACADCVDIKRAHSSGNIQTKMDASFRGCASLQRNGDVAASRRGLLSDKPDFATLQRTQFSTTSLVPL